MDLFVVIITVLMVAFILGVNFYLEYEDEKYWRNEVKEGRAKIIYIRRF